MYSNNGATDCEAAECNVNENKISTAAVKEGVCGEKNGNRIETIELPQKTGSTLGISIKGGTDHPFLVSKDDRVRQEIR